MKKQIQNTGNKKGHLTKEERFCIQKMLENGRVYRDIATVLARGASTVCEEVLRNGGRDVYDAEVAHRRAHIRQYRKKRDCLKVACDPLLSRYVEEALRTYHSPERISGALGLWGYTVNKKAIYKFVYSRSLERYLYTYRKHRRRGKRSGSVEWKENRVFVDDPRCVREGYGHWEGDFVVSAHSTHVLFVATERVTKETVVRLLPNRTNDLVREVVCGALHGKTVRSLTVDNDIAFIQHRELSEALQAPVYFARPFRSTDKALVENTNRWIRWFIPKKTDLQSVPLHKVQWVEEWLNTAPRQCLGFRSAREVAQEMVSLEGIKITK
jgi:IS30 family transposase